MKNKIKLTICCLWIILFSSAQSGKLFSVDTELSSSLINHICQDRYGVIWIATEDGLNRYDGAKFTIYKNDQKDRASLLENYVRYLFEDSKGELYIGLLKGLQIYDQETGSFKEIPLFFPDYTPYRPHITSILERRNGDILVGTSGQGIYILNQENETYGIQNTELTPSLLILYMFEDDQENLWVSTEDNGVFRLSKDGKCKKFGFKDTGWNLVTNICQDNNGNLLLGSMINGLFMHDKESDSFIPIPYLGEYNLPVKTIYITDDNKIYIGTDGQGIKIADLDSRQIIDEEFNVSTFDLSKSKVHSILQDRSGNFWLGIFQKGVSVIPAISNQFNYIGYKSVSANTIGSNCVMSLFKDHEGILWVGTDNDGLYGIYPDGRQKVHFKYTKAPHSIPSVIMSIYEDSDHNIWLGSYLHGIAKMDRKTGKCEYKSILPDPTSGPVQRIFSIVEDHDKNLWVGTMGSGLYCMNLRTEEITHYDSATGNEYRTDVNFLNHTYINELMVSSDGKLYIATYDGLGCMDIESRNFVSTYGRNRLLVGSVVYTMYEDKTGTIWLGTSNGLYYIDKRTQEFIAYTTEDGLPSNVICGIREDEGGNLWISTHYGISKMNRREKTFINYYASDGLQGNEFSKGAALKGENGAIFFGGTNGVTWFRPAQITHQEKELEIRITDFYIDNKPVRKGMKSGKYTVIDTSVMEADKFRLSYKDNSFSIEFSTMEFNNPERITYHYSVNNDTWSTLTPGSNRVTFSDLAPGKYYFKVRAQDYNMVSNIKEIFITIAPPWYLSIWARITYIVIALGIIYLIVQQIRHRYQVRQEMLEHQHAQEINEAKLQFFINIAHEIRTPMSLIISPLKKLISKDPDQERQRDYYTIHRNAERILNLINQLMDIRKIDKGLMFLKFRETELISFIEDLYSMFEQPAKTKNIQFTFHHEQDELPAWVDPINFDKIILNILSNAFKFTPENGRIDIYLRTGEEENVDNEIQEYFEIVISDSGIGVKEEDMERIFERFYQIRNNHNNSNFSTGIGLHLTRSLVELHYGMIWVENNDDGKGCSFIIRMPLGNSHLTQEEIEMNPEEITSKPDIQSPPISAHFTESRKKKTYRKHKQSIMIVEDDDEIRKYVAQELEAEYHVSKCINGKEALESILKNPPDLVISDIMMPEMDGITLCRQIKKNININHIPVILLTAKAEEEDTLEGLRIGADAYITKPFNIEILIKNVENIIRNREILKNTFAGNQQQNDKVQKVNIKSPDDDLMGKIMKVISDNLSNPDLNVEIIATEIGISRVHLHRKLKELTNQSPATLIRNIRLKQAADLLANNPHMNISEISDATGFTYVASFSTVFKNFYGMSPTAWMEMHQQQKTVNNE